jgi:hypothetical protein
MGTTGATYPVDVSERLRIKVLMLLIAVLRELSFVATKAYPDRLSSPGSLAVVLPLLSRAQ